VYSDVTLSPNPTWTSFPALLGGGVGAGTTATYNFNGAVLPSAVTLRNDLGTLSLAGNLTTTSTVDVSIGTTTDNGYTISGSAITWGATGNIFNTVINKTGTWIATSTGTVFTASSPALAGVGFTINDTVGAIKLTDTSSTQKTFVGGGKAYNRLWYAPGTGIGTLNITGSNTFNDFKDDGTAAHSILFTAGTTTNVNTFTVSGNPGALITIGSATAADHYLNKGSGHVSSDYLSISRSRATRAKPATWFAGTHSTDGGNNTGWVFTAPVPFRPSGFLSQ